MGSIMTSVKIAAAGDIHCHEQNRDAMLEAFEALDGEVDLLLLAGDLTTHGEPEQAEVLAEACRSTSLPVVAVLGNHDFHAGRADEVTSILEDAGIELLGRGRSTHLVAADGEVGVAGVKGFVGGFRGLGLPDFGEPSLRAIYAETGAEVEALAEGLREIAPCPLRIALLHYAPTTTTLVGEPPVIWAFLGSDRLAEPIEKHQPDVVLHGHGHAGTFEGSIDGVPVYNVAVPVIGRDFWIFDLEGGMETPAEHPEIHVEAEAAQTAPGPH
jgi:Icc-related predicted phosphoesterase